MHEGHEHAGHGHEHHSHEHDNMHTHENDHHHSSGTDKNAALLSYMLEHSKSHAREYEGVMNNLEHAGNPEAARVIAVALELFNDGNNKVSQALRLLAEE